MEENVITSLQNTRVKRLVQLQQKSSERRRTGLFVVEGQRELQHCLEAGYEVEAIYMVEGGGWKVEGELPLGYSPSIFAVSHRV